MGELIMPFFTWSSRGVRTPVVEGYSTPPVEPCYACGYGDDHGVLRVRAVVSACDVIVCLDTAACIERYRSGVSPETYAAGLRGELLAVTP